MAYSARILADSVSRTGCRLTTFEVTFPRIVLAEFNTHRVFSRNSASSRAIPVEKMLKRIEEDLFIPIYWGKNQKGMQADQELTEAEQYEARYAWVSAKEKAVEGARALLKLGVHKQIANRLLEPFMWQTVLVTATEYENFFALRCHRDAQPEIREIAVRMRDLYRGHEPTLVPTWKWHLPLVEDQAQLEQEGYTLEDIRRIAVGRCARVSYLTHDGKRDPKADLELCARLQASGHMSPFEHVARALPTDSVSGNFVGWEQYRKGLAGEAIYTPSSA